LLASLAEISFLKDLARFPEFCYKRKSPNGKSRLATQIENKSFYSGNLLHTIFFFVLVSPQNENSLCKSILSPICSGTQQKIPNL